MGNIVLEAELSPDDWNNLGAAADEQGTPAVPGFSMVAYRGGVMRPRMSIAAYGEGIVVDLSSARVVSGQLPIHYVHDVRDPVGHAESVDISTVIKITGKLSVPGESRDKITGGARNGFRWRPSISARNYTVERLLPDQTATVNGRKVRGPVLIARNAEIFETSFLSVAGDPSATATVTASHSVVPDPETVMTFEEFLAACGVQSSAIDETQRANLQAAYDAQYGDDGEEGDDPPAGGPVPNQPRNTPRPPVLNAAADNEEYNRQIAANRARVNQINTLCAAADNPRVTIDGNEVDLCSHAIQAGMDPRDVELHILRAGRPRGPGIHSRSSEDTQNVEAMTAALLLASGIELDNPCFTSTQALYAGVPQFLRYNINDENRQRLMEAGHRYGSVNLLDLAADAVEAETGNRPRGRENRIEAAASSGSLSQIYAHTVGASLLVGFMEQVGSLRQWTTQDFLPDFKKVQRFNEDAEESLEKLDENGEAAHATAGATFEYMQVDIYARQWEINRKAYVNNNLGLIGRKPRKMGQTARRLEEDFGYAAFMANPTMNSTGRALFNSTDGTLHTTHALTRANASKAVAYMMNRQDGEATLDLMLGHCLTPTELMETSKQIWGSTFVDSSEGTRNTLRDYGVMTVGSPRLSNGVKNPDTKAFATGSTTAWYTVAKDIETIVRLYLNETGGVPQTRVTPLTQGKWGTHIDVAFDFGIGIATFRGMDKFTA